MFEEIRKEEAEWLVETEGVYVSSSFVLRQNIPVQESAFRIELQRAVYAEAQRVSEDDYVGEFFRRSRTGRSSLMHGYKKRVSSFPDASADEKFICLSQWIPLSPVHCSPFRLRQERLVILSAHQTCGLGDSKPRLLVASLDRRLHRQSTGREGGDAAGRDCFIRKDRRTPKIS